MFMRVSTAIAVVGLLMFASPSARADVDCGDPLAINGSAGPEFGGTVWGTHAPAGGTNNGQPHPFCGQSVYEDAFFPGLTINVTSLPILPPPPGKKFAGVISIDFTAFFPGDFTQHIVDIPLIKDPAGANYINQLIVTTRGTDGTTSPVPGATTDGYSIHVDVTGVQLGQQSVMDIFWTQIPEPASLSLLALGGLAMLRRRKA
ncbi:MAG: PEP-CTERM sorting domain-containing protein [Phycisphaerae bacterium]|nr:PEP-CTERM sorting domain-containing protein [Phycisphaerae bacterium]NUQ46451.1 PEP-CTERM sorting domain-containing protein [Phycisphaerae bacterium]